MLLYTHYFTVEVYFLSHTQTPAMQLTVRVDMNVRYLMRLEELSALLTVKTSIPVNPKSSV